jgi:hypothetical protein
MIWVEPVGPLARLPEKIKADFFTILTGSTGSTG